MNSSSNASQLPPPPIIWAQRKDKILLTIQFENCSSPTITFKDSSLYFHGKGGSANTEHEVLVEFNKEIDTEASTYHVTDREILVNVVKKIDSLGFWPRLLKDPKKVHFLKTDFDKWKDEDDSDVEEGRDDFNLDEMMSSMGGLQGGPEGAPDLDQDQEDSDDEDLPDLQE